MAAVPAELPPGNFSLAVRTAPNGKDIREGRYDGVVISPVLCWIISSQRVDQ